MRGRAGATGRSSLPSIRTPSLPLGWTFGDAGADPERGTPYLLAGRTVLSPRHARRNTTPSLLWGEGRRGAAAEKETVISNRSLLCRRGIARTVSRPRISVLRSSSARNAGRPRMVAFNRDRRQDRVRTSLFPHAPFPHGKLPQRLWRKAKAAAIPCCVCMRKKTRRGGPMRSERRPGQHWENPQPGHFMQPSTNWSWPWHSGHLTLYASSSLSAPDLCG